MDQLKEYRSTKTIMKKKNANITRRVRQMTVFKEKVYCMYEVKSD